MLKGPSLNNLFPIIVGIFIGSVVCIPGCYLVEPEDTQYSLEIETEHTHHTLGAIGEEVRVHIKNKSNVPLYLLIPSGYVELEKHTQTGWHNLGLWYGWIGIPPSPYAIEPGETFSGVPLQLTSEIIDGPGLYRFRFKLYKNIDPLELMPLDKRVSNPFMISS